MALIQPQIHKAVLDPTLLPPVFIRITGQTKEQAEATYKGAANAIAEPTTVSSMPGTKYTYNASSGTQMTAYVITKGALTVIIEESGGYSDELTKIIASLNLT
jgi:hypothetical protein